MPVATLDITVLDKELARLVPGACLAQLASRGLRGELMFAVPALLKGTPRLLGYYRLLLGFSQKAFYTHQFGLTTFKSMETRGSLLAIQSQRLDELCAGLIASAAALLEGIGVDRISRDLLGDLALLTVGPQLRGGHNVKLGLAGIVKVFAAIRSIVAPRAVRTDSTCIEVRNAAGRRVLIEFSPDPDIIIREEMAKDMFRNIVAIEVKGGLDFSNIHNRIGEAEKSHQKARLHGFHECWTVVNVDRIDLVMARRESPSTNRFYRLSQIDAGSGAEFIDFRQRIVSYTGIPSIG